MLNKLNLTMSSNKMSSNKNSRHIKNQLGFSLIEIMIVVAIIGVLASIAYPSYLEEVRKSNRGELIANVLECASIQERVFTVQNTYNVDACATVNAENDIYDITVAVDGVNAGRASQFTVTAEPIPGGRMDDDDSCISFTYNFRGLKVATASDGTPNTDICWRT